MHIEKYQYAEIKLVALQQKMDVYQKQWKGKMISATLNSVTKE